MKYQPSRIGQKNTNCLKCQKTRKNYERQRSFKNVGTAKFITSSPEYKKIIQKYFNDEFLDEAFGKVFNSGKLESFRVAKDIDVQGIAELKEVVESINGKWVGIQSTPLGKFAY